MKYTIDYGFGEATLYTPYDAKERFYALANTCFGIRKSIMHCVILKAEDIPCEDFERLEFNGDVYVWREDGARKMVAPLWAADKEWDMDDCEMVRYKPKEGTIAKEYIEREKAIEWFMAFVHMGESDIPAETVISDLKYAIPAADVAPVRHGEWLKAEDDYCGLNIIQCSICHEEWCFEIDDDVIDLNYHYCPNCGAYMMGENNGKCE